ncbi:MAG: type IX secretion system sortase PorU, partial [Bacteroidota bacterium]
MRARHHLFFILFSLIVSFSFAQQAAHKQFAAHSVLAEGRWFKIATIVEGVYQLTYADLIASGATPPFNANDFRLFGNGGSMLPEKIADFRFDDLKEKAVQVADGGDGFIDNNDYILFYGEATSKWSYSFNTQSFGHQLNYYADSSYYFFTFDKGMGQRVEMAPLITDAPNLTVDCFNEHVFHELDSVNLIKSGKQWLGEVFDDITPKSFSFVLPDLSDTAMLTARINLMARCMQESAFQVNLNGFSIADTLLPVDGNVNSEYSKSSTLQFDVLPSSDSIKIEISYNKPEVSSQGWLNYIELQGVRKLVYRGQQIRFRNIQTIGQDISQFNINNLGNAFHVWTVDDYGALAEMPLAINGNTTSFKAHTPYTAEFIAFDANNAMQPALLGQIPNQDLHGMPQAELVIVTHPLFLSQANEVADFHRNNDLMNVAVATTQQVYNEFSSGKQDPSAIRDFVRMFYDRGASDTNNRVRYLLLFGDGSYDMKQRIPQNTNMVPTWQTDNSVLPISSYVSDDFYGMLDSLEGDNLNGDLDVGVGRFPVSTVADADILVAKTLRYGIKKDLVENSYENGKVSNYD